VVGQSSCRTRRNGDGEGFYAMDIVIIVAKEGGIEYYMLVDVCLDSDSRSANIRLGVDIY
jgi:hypothetical protein